jgi:beta-carotene 15,15'-dioxygenase
MLELLRIAIRSVKDREYIVPDLLRSRVFPKTSSRHLIVAIAAGLSGARFEAAKAGSSFALLHGRCVVAIYIGLISVHLLVTPVDLLNWPIICGVMLLVLGVPHGSFDIAVMKSRLNLARHRDVAAALALYLGLAALVLVSWYFMPSVCLVIFLLIAAYHFGGGPSLGPDAPSRLMHGAALLAATAIFHRIQVGDIFAWLCPRDFASGLAAVMQACGLIVVVAASVSIARLSRSARWPATEHAVVLSAAVILPPMTFFLIYFCFLHSVRHLIAVRGELSGRPLGQLLREAMPYALVAVAASAGGAALFVELEVGPALLASIFVALAALTVPHMLLVDLIGQRIPEKNHLRVESNNRDPNEETDR